MSKQFWLVKQEPESYSWDDFVKDRGTAWTGIRNFAARLNLRKMKKGDLVFYYHSVSGKEIVGIAKVTKEHFPDPTADEGDWSAVELAPLKPVQQRLSLEQIKKDKLLKEMLLVRQSRLSTMPVTAEQAERILELTRTKV